MVDAMVAVVQTENALAARRRACLRAPPHLELSRGLIVVRKLKVTTRVVIGLYSLLF
jgi:hypothetical protein